MSWFRSAVTKVMVARGKNNLSHTVRSYADSVVQQTGHAVAEGSKLPQDRIGGSNSKSFNDTMKRLEEVAVSCTGLERTQLLRRWLIQLKETEKLSGSSIDDKEKVLDQHHAFDESKESPANPSLVLYYDSDLVSEPMNFRDVFLHSRALEGITLSMILEAPNEEEASLLLEIFCLCLTGEREVHNAIVSSIQDLAKVFSNYQDEVLVKRAELLQYAQGAISGLKINADLSRIDAETSSLQQKFEERRASRLTSTEAQVKESEKTALATLEALKEAFTEVRLFSRLGDLLLKKKLLNNGDTPEIHSQKVDKLKILSESLANSTLKAEKRISDHRQQKEEALNFRITKSAEVGETEKEIAAEILALERQKDELEAELQKVNLSLVASRARLQNTREEREHFEEASNQIVAHLQTKEEDLSRSIYSCRVEADVVNMWVNFLQDMWVLQTSYTEQKEKQASDELEKYEQDFVDLVIHHLSAYKRALGPSIIHIRKFAENLKNLDDRQEMVSGVDTDDAKALNSRNNLEEEYLDSEAKIITALSVVDNMKEYFYRKKGKVSRKDEPRAKELFEAIEQIKEEFQSIERPTLDMETPTPNTETLSDNVQQKSSSPSPTKTIVTMLPKNDDSLESPSAKAEQSLDPKAQLEKLESEFGKISKGYSNEEISEWEFDDIEELRTGASVTNK
ncbi:PREDICTED: CAP-Gly domain-containing linker protein 1-like isoform X2 [Nelumbo nucifera]|uniref:CAP-Gly domain-containing linker protein 1-like isoform X2 n=2 Tax=Nelumbo nucifera TaxID=4432 RepID=A0A1U8A564_NELNU|nr:PREDICTED: CAP-Gly domain-containing linker protein 1-like isoform X2 [Nelumbo nucifera]DAD27803.1 TPA_asm: hypothetical protein HUJ06_029271 [Nelumbo nucifera]